MNDMAKKSNEETTVKEALHAPTIDNRAMYDVVIVGAGMSGALLALSLLKKNAALSVLLLDENPERVAPVATANSADNPSFDARCIALNAGSVDALRELSLWQDIQGNAQAIEKIQVSDKGYFGAPELQPETEGLPFGYVVELAHVGQVLARALAAFTSSLTTLYNVKLTALEQKSSLVTCQLSNGESINAKLCVGADGSDSQVRALAKIEFSNHDYHRSAMICNVRCAKPHQSTAYERFTKSGPIALLPLTDNRYSLVYCIENKDVEDIHALSEGDFLRHLQQQFGFRAGIFEEAGQRDVYPLRLLTSKRPIAHRVVCIGNAAHNLHPVAGQGFNLGLRDLTVLAKVIAESQQIGAFPMLNHYWKYRKEDHNKTILMTDSLVRIFSNQYPLLSIPRNIGLQIMSLFPSLSQPIIKQAKGQFDLFNRENLS